MIIFTFIQKAIIQGIGILFGTVGEIVTEKSGHLNLGIPGLMYMGGIAGLMALFMGGKQIMQMVNQNKLQKQQQAVMENMMKMFESGGMPDMGEMQKQREEQNKKLQAILTKDQFTAWTKHEEERMQQMMNGGGFGGPGPR